MNPHDPELPDESEAEIAQLLSQLNQLAPSLEARVKNRLTIAHELARIQAEPRPRADVWWKRSIRVPVPLAFGLALSLALMTVVSFRQPASQPDQYDDLSLRPWQLLQDSEFQLKKYERVASSKEERLELSVSNTYLCGVGPLSTETRYVILESRK